MIQVVLRYLDAVVSIGAQRSAIGGPHFVDPLQRIIVRDRLQLAIPV